MKRTGCRARRWKGDVVSTFAAIARTAPGHFRQIESASLTVPLVISFAEPFAIGLGTTARRQ